MQKILVLHAHPAPRHSITNNQLGAVAKRVEGVTFVDLYERYPRFKIDVDKEQAQLTSHDIIIVQFPLMWYSTPALLKEWQDLVLEYGFAYGEGGNALRGKTLLPVVSAGGSKEAYTSDGHNQFELRTFLTPLEQTANLCSMRFLPPYTLFGSLKVTDDGRLNDHVAQYEALLEALRDNQFDHQRALELEILSADNLPITAGAA